MSLRQRIWAGKQRSKLVTFLGGECWACGSKHELEFDHPYGRKWKLREKDISWRMSIYRKEALSGLLRLLCATHNGSNEFIGVYLAPPASVTLLKIPLEETQIENQPF